MTNETEAPHGITCIGFIMDGNRRWAKARGLHTLEGHRKGAEVFEDSVRFVRDHCIPHAVYYAFSSENWGRSEEEVAYLLDLFAEEVGKLIEKLEKEDEKQARFRFIGELERFSPAFQEKIREAEEKSAKHQDTTIWVALSYGGRAEIIAAVNAAIERGTPTDEESFRALLWLAEMPDPDLIVRTGGQQRLSNFLTWQSVYSELFFIEKHWPDVTHDDLGEVLAAYSARKRNFGK